MRERPHGWRWDGRDRPPFAVAPRAGQESVWDYPRPPRIVSDQREVIVCAGDVEIARTSRALRVLETASPPTFYLPRDDVRTAHLVRAGGTSWCEWKGAATYWDVTYDGARLERAAWSYESPSPPFAAITGHLSFYPARLACFVDGVRVRPQPGGFYGGWVTPEIVGPYKGDPGTGGW